MKMIADACSIILLAKSSVLSDIVDTYNLFITKEVYGEVMEGKNKKFQDALLLEKLYNEKKIKIIKAKYIITKKIMEDFNMDEGEASSIAACLTGKNIIVATDNKQGRKAAQINNLPLVGSIEIILSLYKKKKISLEKAKSALEILKKEGWFNIYLIEKAMEDLK